VAQGLRTLVVDDVRYLWKVEHRHVMIADQRTCREVFSAFREGHKAAPLRIEFTSSAVDQAGYPEKGVVWTTDEPSRTANLNTPAIAATLVREGLRRGWKPESERRPFVLAEGFAWLRATRAES
jgi:hypothetical protein